jgi:hypothetical protein
MITRELIFSGVLPENVGTDNIDTRGDRRPDGTFAWWSCSRGDTGCNGVLVVRL